MTAVTRTSQWMLLMVVTMVLCTKLWIHTARKWLATKLWVANIVGVYLLIKSWPLCIYLFLLRKIFYLYSHWRALIYASFIYPSNQQFIMYTQYLTQGNLCNLYDQRLFCISNVSSNLEDLYYATGNYLPAASNCMKNKLAKLFALL